MKKKHNNNKNRDLDRLETIAHALPIHKRLTVRSVPFQIPEVPAWRFRNCRIIGKLLKAHQMNLFVRLCRIA